MKRTQEEILQRFETADDFFGTQRVDLVSFMTFENAKKFLNDDFVLKVESGEEKWEPSPDAKTKIVEYLPFAYDKAEGQRGLSAARSLLHFKTWIWLDDPDFYDEIISEMEDYYGYGIPVLDKISAKYGFVRP